MRLTSADFIRRYLPVSARIVGIMVFLIALLFSGWVAAESSPSGKVYRIGYLGARSADPAAEAAFREELRKLGYIEGKNVLIVSRYAGLVERPLGDLAAGLAEELVHFHVDVIVTSPAPAVISAAQHATRTIPIVMPYAMVDPVAAGFVQSLAQPGGNITGLINLESELYGKRLELLKDAVPGISRVAILFGPEPPKEEVRSAVAAGKALGIDVQALVLPTPRLRDLEHAFMNAGRSRFDALLVSKSRFLDRHPERVIDLVGEKQLPTIYSEGHFVHAGGLMSYEADLAELHRRAAGYVDRILKGAKPAELPVEHPAKFVLFINLKTAGKLNLSLPRSMLDRADEVIR